MVTLQDFKSDLPLLMETGLIAIKQGDEESAKKLFNAIGIIEPENTSKKLGYGLIALHKMDIKNAQKAFLEIIQSDEKNWRAKAFLAFSYVLSTLQDIPSDDKLFALKQGAELALEVLDKSDIETTRQLAQSVIDWEKEMQNKMSGQGPVR